MLSSNQLADVACVPDDPDNISPDSSSQENEVESIPAPDK